MACSLHQRVRRPGERERWRRYVNGWSKTGPDVPPLGSRALSDLERRVILVAIHDEVYWEDPIWPDWDDRKAKGGTGTYQRVRLGIPFAVLRHHVRGGAGLPGLGEQHQSWADDELWPVLAGHKKLSGRARKKRDELPAEKNKVPRVKRKPNQGDFTNVPEFEGSSGAWVRNGEAASLEGVKTRSLARYRSEGRRSADGMVGEDPAGRVWRRTGTPRSHPWYLRKSLTTRRKA